MDAEEAAADGYGSTFDAIAGRRKWEGGVVPYVYGSVGKIILFILLT